MITLKRAAIVPLVLSAIVTGCATGTYTPPATIVQVSPNERIVERSFDETWSLLVDYASKAFFAIDGFEKASGLMTLSFGSTEPERFVDCGRMRLEAPNATVDEPYARYLSTRHSANLNGKMNIVVRSVDSARTLVRANARYIFQTPARPQPPTPAQTWAFDTGGSATVAVSNALAGTIPTRTCLPTYAAERAIIDAVSK